MFSPKNSDGLKRFYDKSTETKEVVNMYNEKEFLNTITSIEQSETSELLIAKSEIIIPESKILLLDDMQIETSPNILLR